MSERTVTYIISKSREIIPKIAKINMIVQEWVFTGNCANE